MVDASALIDSLGKDELDQRVVKEHLMSLAKVRGKGNYRHRCVCDTVVLLSRTHCLCSVLCVLLFVIHTNNV